MPSNNRNVTNVQAVVDWTSDGGINGSVTTVALSPTITGTDTRFLSELRKGDLLKVPGEPDREVLSITSDVLATAVADFTVGVGPVTGVEIEKTFEVNLGIQLSMGRGLGTVEPLGTNVRDFVAGNKEITVGIRRSMGLDTESFMHVMQEGHLITMNVEFQTGFVIILSGGKLPAFTMDGLDGGSNNVIETNSSVTFTDWLIVPGP